MNVVSWLVLCRFFQSQIVVIKLTWIKQFKEDSLHEKKYRSGANRYGFSVIRFAFDQESNTFLLWDKRDQMVGLVYEMPQFSRVEGN